MRISQDTLKTLLTTSARLAPDVIKQAETIAAQTNEPLDRIVVRQKLIGERELVALYAKSINLPYIDLTNVKIAREVLTKIPERIAKRYQTVLFGQKDGTWLLATSDPEDIQALDVIEKQLGGKIQVHVAITSDILNALDQYRTGLDTEIDQAIKDSSDSKASVETANTEDLSNDAPIAKTVNIILEYAYKNRASDVHIEPRENIVQIRYRIDGILRESMTLPRQILPAVVSRIKIMANLKIDEHRVPQDGRFKSIIGSKTIAVRVATLPVMEGEKVVMRILDESTKPSTLEELGFWGDALKTITNSMKQPHGMILVTGPTGAGKSTTLYSTLTQMNSPSVNISTIEDPVEYRIQGVNQTQVNVQAGMTFANGLRALLRQDPNVIMVGEIRDSETADLAVQAALTGHTVLSTLHTNNAATTLPRLLDMNIEPFLIATTVNTIVAQRLVRRLCPACKETYVATPEMIDEIRQSFVIDRAIAAYQKLINPGGPIAAQVAPVQVAPAIKPAPAVAEPEPDKPAEPKHPGESRKVIPVPQDIQLERNSILDRIAADPNIIERSSAQPETVAQIDAEVGLPEPTFVPVQLKPVAPALTPAQNNTPPLTLYRAKGCKQCDQSGFTGRMGIYEVLDITPDMGKLITGKATADEIQKTAVDSGMMTMQEDGFVKAMQGLTTIEEVVRVTRE